MKLKNIRKLQRNLSSIRNALLLSQLPSIEAEVLLAHILQKPRTYLFAHPEEKLTFENFQKFEELFKRRAQGEPIAYITGEKEFYGLKVKIDSRALIPRPETEELVMEALKLNPKSVADIGTGSGAVALALASRLPDAKIFATDISSKALALAQENAAELGLKKRIAFLQGNLADPLPEKVDLMVANLPYIMSGWIDKLSQEIKDFEPRLALDGGTDGMKYYKVLFKQANKHLNDGGKILYELDGRVLVHEP